MTNSNRNVPRVAAWRRYLTFWRTPIAQDVDDELRFHTNMRVNELMARGMPEDEARRAVAERLGDMHSVQSACVELSQIRERNKRNAALLDAFRNDLRTRSEDCRDPNPTALRRAILARVQLAAGSCSPLSLFSSLPSSRRIAHLSTLRMDTGQ
jgi:hypothetical protein